MGNYTTTALNAVFKELWLGRDLTELAYNSGDRPLFTAADKDESVGGKQTNIPCLVEDGQGYASVFATAQSNTSAATLKQFAVTTVELYGVARVDSKAVALSRNDRGSLVRAMDIAMKSGINGMANVIESAMFRTAGGSIGDCNETSGTTVTMKTSLRDINNFAVGMKIVFAADESSAPRDSGKALEVTAVNRVAGSLTVGANLSTISGLSSGDLIFREGTYVDAADAKMISGLAAWCPASAPSATAFFSVNRTTDTRLGGYRYTGTGLQIEEAILNGASFMAENGGSGATDVALCSFTDFRTLVAEMGAKVTRSAGKLAQAGFQAIELFGPKGIIEVIPCAKCPAGHIYVGQMSTLKLLSAGSAIQVDAEEGLEWSKVYNQAAYECRLVFFGNMALTNTAAWCHVTV